MGFVDDICVGTMSALWRICRGGLRVASGSLSTSVRTLHGSAKTGLSVCTAGSMTTALKTGSYGLLWKWARRAWCEGIRPSLANLWCGAGSRKQGRLGKREG